jgi:hypothetical protein
LALALALYRGGFDGLLRDKTRLSRIKPLGAETVERVVALTLGEPLGERTHWTGALMAKATGLSVISVQRIWRAHGLQPHRMRQFKLSNDPRFVVNCATSSGSMSIHPHTPSSCRRRKEPDSGA